MKKRILFIATMLLIGTVAQASKQTDTRDRGYNRYQHKKQISFIENGVLFHVYPNGEVDFKTPRRRNRYQTNWGTAYNNNSPGHTRNYNRPTVRYDYYGRLKKVGYTTIAYNRYDQTRRIGSVLIYYNRRGLISKIGGLHIRYNRAGRIHNVEGNVHYTGCGYCGIDGCSTTHNPYYRAATRNHANSNRHRDHHQVPKKDKREKKHTQSHKR